ncbi:EpsD family peptidyl-prolyl cis-trans isomerase [Paludibacterium yongneupense]|uniref:EpsD family peptidyl-prolyl cis-trans isomerase n=1 Tax=Paludibacterium yongneupense TaxID=400061 RepID=UPI0004072B13|nr:EpsD family peptidyl-prolyl cis-trans isomerase [Paludibacterium yongneupense]
MTSNKWVGGVVLAATIVVAGCGKHDAKAPSQVLARVNDAEITVLQLNGVLANQPQAQNNPALKQAALEQLVEQEVLVQKAAELKLDRDPDVMQAIEQSKRQILANAAAQRVVGKIDEPSQAEVDDFFAKNPGLFSARKIYDFAVFQLSSADLKAPLLDELNHSQSPDQTQVMLNKAQVKFQGKMARMPAEQLPLPLVSRLTGMKVGDVAQLQQGPQTTLLQLVHAEAAPVDAKQAKPAILTFLRSQRGQSEAHAKIEALKAAAKVVYVKRFSETASAPVPAPAAAAAPAAAKDNSLNNGLKGLQ